jgi:hypothetical protein
MSPADRERDVLTSLPNARPTRRSAKRPPRAGGAEAEEPAKKPAAARKTAPRRPAASAAARRPEPAKRPRAAAKRPRAAAKPKAAPKVAAAQPSTPPPPPAGWASPKQERRHDGSTGDLIGTAVQAVGELAQIGLTYGGQAIRQALSRLPKP